MPEDGTEHPTGPEKEVLDYVERKGPITTDQIVEDCGIWSPDDVYEWLSDLEDRGFVSFDRDDLERYGTTEKVWFVDTGTKQEDTDG